MNYQIKLSSSLLLTVLCAVIFQGCDGPKVQEFSKVIPEPEINTVYAPMANSPYPGAMYPRVIRIEHFAGEEGTLLATFEHYMNREPSFPIYRSTDNGETWNLYSEVEDTHNNFGMKYQPHLFELPQQVNEFPAGTIFCTGSSIPEDMSSTELLVYFSTDGGKSWEFLSSIVKGGRAIYPNEGETPVWEPFLGLDSSGRMVAYYSDERFYDDGYSQLLAHMISEDGGRTWGEPVFDVAVPDNKTRPGMSIVTRLPNGKYMMVFELVGVEGIPVHYKLSDDGIDWGDPEDLGTKIENEEGHFVRGTPYVIWTPYGGENGTLLVSGMFINVSGEEVGDGYMINRNLGEGKWTHLQAPLKYKVERHAGYSQTMVSLGHNGQGILQMIPVLNEREEQCDIKSAKFRLP